MIEVLAKPYQKCLTFVTTSCGRLLLSFFFGGYVLYKDVKHIPILGSNRGWGEGEGLKGGG